MSELDLGLPFDDEPDTRRARRRQREKRQRDRRRALTAMLLVLTIFVLLGGGIWYGVDKVGALLAAPDYPGPGTGQVVVQVQPLESASDIAVTLEAKGVVKSTKAFVEAATAEPRSRGIQPGSYQLRKEMKAADALMLLLDSEAKVTLRFTVPEGLSAVQTYKVIADQTGLSQTTFKAAAKNAAAVGVPAWGGGNVEGFLFPDTYELDPGTDAAGVLKAMVARSVQVMEQIDFLGKAQAVNLEPMEALKVASLVEEEAKEPDFGKVARVVYNRLKVGMALQYDSTTLYGRELRGLPRVPTEAGGMYEALRDPSDPYSTYTNQDLPPTPISNPGKAALEAAVTPERGDWIYFVVVTAEGRLGFATTLAEHNQNVVRCRAVGKCN
jgi:UPF0755 protein